MQIGRRARERYSRDFPRPPMSHPPAEPGSAEASAEQARNAKGNLRFRSCLHLTDSKEDVFEKREPQVPFLASQGSEVRYQERVSAIRALAQREGAVDAA